MYCIKFKLIQFNSTLFLKKKLKIKTICVCQCFFYQHVDIIITQLKIGCNSDLNMLIEKFAQKNT